ncbi:MAG TPA: Ig-like domain-containing protein, partial [Gemmatimonadaceae bacterium]
MPRLHNAASAVALILLAACAGDTTAPATNNPPPPPGPAPINTIDLSPSSATLSIGQTTTLAATAKSAAGAVLTGRTLTWTSSTAAVASVDANGVVTGVAAGTATITVAGEGKSATAAITVNAPQVPVAKVAVTTALDTVEAYDPKTMTAVTRDAKDSVLTGRVVRWSSSNTAVATIDSVTGQLLGIDRGTVTITATSEGKTGSASRVIVIKYRSMVAGSMHACDIASGGFV